MSSGNGLLGMFESITQPLMTYLWFPPMYSFIGSIGIFLAMWQRMDVMQDEQWRPQATEKFDFIVGKLYEFKIKIVMLMMRLIRYFCHAKQICTFFPG